MGLYSRVVCVQTRTIEVQASEGFWHKLVIAFLRPRHFLKKNLEEAPLKSSQIWKATWMQEMIDSDWLRRRLRCRWLVILSDVKTDVRYSYWLYKLFSHFKIKRIDFYKQALRNNILVIRVIRNIGPLRYNKEEHRRRVMLPVPLTRWKVRRPRSPNK